MPSFRDSTFFGGDAAMKTVIDYEGRDITQWILDAAHLADIDPIYLLALIKAESGLNGKAERYGTNTQEFLQRLLWYNRGDRSQATELQRLIDEVWPDISFGYSQRIVLYHDYGDRSTALENVLAVRQQVFTNPEEDIQAAASRLAEAKNRSLDDTYLGAMVVYNAGSDRRDDSEWMSKYGANVRAYATYIAWAEENYRDEQQEERLSHLNEIWGLANELDSLNHGSIAIRLRERVVALKELL